MSKEKRKAQLGMDYGTASSQLKKLILLKLIKEANQNTCFRCGREIRSAKELSIEHKIPWLNSSNPQDLFFDLDNIAFSHLSCNSRAARKITRSKCGKIQCYKNGCRCLLCKKANRDKCRRMREGRRLRTGRDR